MPFSVSSPSLAAIARRKAQQEELRAGMGHAADSGLDALTKMQALARDDAGIARGEAHKATEEQRLGDESAGRLRIAGEQAKEQTASRLRMQDVDRANQWAQTDKMRAAQSKAARERLKPFVNGGDHKNLSDEDIAEAFQLATGEEVTPLEVRGMRDAGEVAAEGDAATIDLKKSTAEKNRRIPIPKPVTPKGARPSSTEKGIEEQTNIDTAISRVDSLIGAVTETGTGPVTALRNKAGRLPIVGDAIDPGAKARMLFMKLAAFKASELKRISGTGVTEGERQAFAKFNANIGDTTSTALAALSVYKEDLARIRGARANAIRMSAPGAAGDPQAKFLRRVQELKGQGLSKEQARAQLKAEGLL